MSWQGDICIICWFMRAAHVIDPRHLSACIWVTAISYREPSRNGYWYINDQHCRCSRRRNAVPCIQNRSAFIYLVTSAPEILAQAAHSANLHGASFIDRRSSNLADLHTPDCNNRCLPTLIDITIAFSTLVGAYPARLSLVKKKRAQKKKIRHLQIEVNSWDKRAMLRALF